MNFASARPDAAFSTSLAGLLADVSPAVAWEEEYIGLLNERLQKTFCRALQPFF